MAWFLFYFGVLSVAVLALLHRHLRQPVALVPASALGKGQLYFLVLLWIVVIANLERALPGFREQRLLTEGTIFLNAVLASVLLLVWPPAAPNGAPVAEASIPLWRAGRWAAAALIGASFAFTGATRVLYGDGPAGHATVQKRFGADAVWRVQPLQSGKKHS